MGERAHGKVKDKGAAESAADGAQEQKVADHRQQVTQWRAEFSQLTGIDPADGNAVKAWQAAHGVPATGIVRSQTVAAARAAKKKKDKAPDGGGGGGDAFAADGDIGEGAAPGEKTENPVMMANIADGAKKMEEHEGGEKGELLEQTGEGVAKAGEGAAAIGLIPETPWIAAASAPHIIDLMRRGEVGKALKALAQEVGPEKALEGLTFVAKKLGLHKIAEHAGEFAEGAGMAGLEVLILEVQWVYEGLSQIREAHEKGDRDSRIAIYAGAFADSFLYGEGAASGAGAVTAEQKEAFENGARDGAATAGATGEQAASIGKALLQKYGSAGGARRGIINELLKHAGISGVKV